MGELIIGLIFLVGVVVVIGVILRVVFGVANAGKRAAIGIVMQNSPVRGEWRGLPLPVEEDVLIDTANLPGLPPPPPGTYHVMFAMPEAHLPAVAGWFQHNWPQAGFILESAPKGARQRSYSFRAPDSSGTVVAAFRLEQSPYVHTAVLLSDLREAE